jgi:hypothetical protein
MHTLSLLHTHMQASTLTHSYTHTNTRTHISTHTHTHTYTHTHTRTHAHTHARMHACTKYLSYNARTHKIPSSQCTRTHTCTCRRLLDLFFNCPPNLGVACPDSYTRRLVRRGIRQGAITWHAVRPGDPPPPRPARLVLPLARLLTEKRALPPAFGSSARSRLAPHPMSPVDQLRMRHSQHTEAPSYRPPPAHNTTRRHQ